jgi:uncharacterized membrane protein
MRRASVVTAVLPGLVIPFVPASILWSTWNGSGGSSADGPLTLTLDSTRLAAPSAAGVTALVSQALFPEGSDAAPKAVVVPDGARRAGEWLVGGGLVLGAAAAVVGLVDFLVVRRARKHVDGWIHTLGNATVLTLALVNLLIHQGDYEDAVLPWRITLSIATVLLLTVTGWYGGELAYRHVVGVTGHGDAPVGEAADAHARAPWALNHAR